MPDFRKKFHILRCVSILLIIGSAAAVSACGRNDAAVSFSLEDPVRQDGTAAEGTAGSAPEQGADGDTFAAVPTAAEDRGKNGDGMPADTAAGDAAEGRTPEEADRSAALSEEPETILVHICGAVRSPGVYELPADSRIIDAVTAGGGFLEEADPNACNLAGKVTDGCQVYIATREETSRMGAALEPGIQAASQEMQSGGSAGDAQTQGGASAQDAAGRVDLNTADVAALKTLPGIGDSRAAAILAWREENGRFTCIEDIMKVNGIKQGAFDKIKDLITVGAG